MIIDYLFEEAMHPIITRSTSSAIGEAIDGRNIALVMAGLWGGLALVVAGLVDLGPAFLFIIIAFLFVIAARGEQRRADAHIGRALACALAEGGQPDLARAA